MNTVLVYSESFSRRSEYIIETLLGEFSGLEIIFSQDKTEFTASALPKFSYSASGFEQIPNIKHSGIIDSDQLRLISFPVPEDFQMNSPHTETDILAFCFFMLSRIEEYNTENLDKHRRFMAGSSLAAKNNSLHLPIVDIYAELLKKWLSAYYSELQFQTRLPSAILTFDIDIAFSLKSKPLLRQAGRMAEEFLTLNFNKLKERLSVLTGSRRDPYDVYDYLAKLSADTQIPMIFFFQVISHGKFDRAARTTSRAFRNLVRNVSEFATVGIHPSYSGGQSAENIMREKSILEDITGKEIIHSRHHFLRLLLPGTARELVKAGILHDFTMGYATHTGWRAGTCRPFKLFDAGTNEMLPLTTCPVSVMDGTLGEYMNLQPDEAAAEIQKIILCTQQYKGTFVPLWHNETISDTGKWKSWRGKVFEPMVAELRTHITPNEKL